MRKTNIVYILALTAALALGVFAQTPAPQTTAKPQAKPAKAAKAAPAPKSDSDIQSCIQTKLAAAPKLKTQGFSVAVSGGVATFTGKATNGGSKGGVTGIAKSCGAKSVVNNITVEKAAKAEKAAKPAKPAAPAKK